MQDEPTPPEVRFLKLLTGALAGVMIAGIVAIVAPLALRLPGSAPPAPLPLPDAIALPDGLPSPEAVTLGRDFVAVIAGDEILVFDRADGRLRQRVALRAAD